MRHGDPDRVLAALGALPESAERGTALRYLQERRPMLAYAAFAAAGWPLGSGSVESAHKHVLQARMKGPGMRWGRATAQAMFALRVILANGRWEVLWPRIGSHQRQAQRTRSAARRVARHPSPPPVAAPLADASAIPPPPERPKLVQQGRPTADHPWRRPLIRWSPATKM